MSVEVVDPGPLTSVQTPSGRPGWQRLGVSVGGAADPWSARLANRLVGNDDEAPLLEATLSGPTLRLAAPTLVAVAGAAWRATLDGLPLEPERPRRGRAGATIRIGGGPGTRLYIAIVGLVVETVLGSAATDLRGGFGGHEGRALRAGDRLQMAPSGSVGSPMRLRAHGARSRGAIRILPGPHASWFTPDVLTRAPWRIGPEADRAGARLHGETVPASRHGGEVPSIALPVGAVQIPPDGRPIVMLADRPVTGGYPVPACVIRADIGRIAQLRPGDELRFASVSASEAVEALRAADDELAGLEPIDLAADDDAGWAGALE